MNLEHALILCKVLSFHRGCPYYQSRWGFPTPDLWFFKLRPGKGWSVVPSFVVPLTFHVDTNDARSLVLSHFVYNSHIERSTVGYIHCTAQGNEQIAKAGIGWTLNCANHTCCSSYCTILHAICRTESGFNFSLKILRVVTPPLWSSGQSLCPQIQRSRVWFPALPDFLRTGSTQSREDNWGATWIKK
jgi:hypothetical protein